MTNKECIESYIKRYKDKGEANNLSFSYGKLFSYNTCIAQFTNDGKLVLNKTKYSTTTSKHRNIIEKNYLYDIIYVYNVPIDATDLIPYINE